MLPKRLFLAAMRLALAGIVFSAGCMEPKWPNGPLTARDESSGYRFEALQLGEGNTDDVFVFLCFSGGGTRAAALAYGVLQGLRSTQLPGGVGRRTLLQEVDVISSASGGSFTAMAYGLDRDHVFDGTFERRFLKKNVQSGLVHNVLRFRNLVRLPYAALGRTDLAARYYDESVFAHRKYGELLQRGDRPFVVVNATNVAMGERFEFTQDDFDFLGSDLATLPVGHAVAASSAYPVLLSPLRLKYYPGEACSSALKAVADWKGTAQEHSRRYKWAASLVPEPRPGEMPRCELDAPNHEFLFLLDGGLTDNLGAGYVLDELRCGGTRERIMQNRVKHLVVILVDANTDVPERIEHRSASPGLFAAAFRAGSIGVYTHSMIRTQEMRFLLRDYRDKIAEISKLCREQFSRCCPDHDVAPVLRSPPVQTYLVNVNFHDIADSRERRKFLSMPTSLFLRNEQVDDLIKIGAELLAGNAEIKRLQAAMQAAGG